MTKLQKLLTKIFMPNMAKGEKLEEPKLKTIPRGEKLDEDKWTDETRAGKLYSPEKYYIIDKPEPTLEELQKLYESEEKERKAKRIIPAHETFKESRIVLEDDDITVKKCYDGN